MLKSSVGLREVLAGTTSPLSNAKPSVQEACRRQIAHRIRRPAALAVVIQLHSLRLRTQVCCRRLLQWHRELPPLRELRRARRLFLSHIDPEGRP